MTLPEPACRACEDQGEAFVDGDWVSPCPDCKREHVEEPSGGALQLEDGDA